LFFFPQLLKDTKTEYYKIIVEKVAVSRPGVLELMVNHQNKINTKKKIKYKIEEKKFIYHITYDHYIINFSYYIN
jgi:hypothetical protein